MWVLPLDLTRAFFVFTLRVFILLLFFEGNKGDYLRQPMQRVLSNSTPLLSGYPLKLLLEAARAVLPMAVPIPAAPSQPRNFLREMDIYLPLVCSSR